MWVGGWGCHVRQFCIAGQAVMTTCMAMVVLIITTLLAILESLFIKIAHDTLSCYFLNPRRIKKIMERQGVRGLKPRPLKGNILDMASLVAKTTSQDMNSINHDIVGLPHYVSWSKQYVRFACFLAIPSITVLTLIKLKYGVQVCLKPFNP